MAASLLTYGPYVSNASGRSALDLLATIIEWRQLLDSDGARQLSSSEALQWQHAVAPLVQSPGILFSPDARIGTLSGTRRRVPGGEGFGGRLLELGAHPDSRISESLLRLTAPMETAPESGLATPGVWFASSANAAAVSQATGDGRLAARVLAGRDLLSLAWMRIERDVEGELQSGAIGTPLQQALLEHWLLWEARLRLSGELASDVRASARTREAETGVEVPMPPLVHRVLQALGGLLIAPPAPTEAEEDDGLPRSRESEDAWRFFANLVQHVAKTLGLGHAPRLFTLERVAEVLLTAQGADGHPDPDRVRQVALDHGVRWLMGMSMHDPEGRWLRDVLLAPLEHLPPSARDQWVRAGRDRARAYLAAHGRRGLHLGAIWEHPVAADGSYTSSFEDVWEGVPSSSPLLWRVGASVAGLDPSTRPLPSSLVTGTWAWCVWGKPEEVVMQVRALGDELLRTALDEGDEAVVLRHLRLLSADQLAACSAATWRPWLLQPYRSLRTWALGALGQSADPAARAGAEPHGGRGARGARGHR